MNSNNPGIYNGIGMAYKHLKNFEKALHYLDMALEMSPEEHEFLLQRSNLHLQMKEYEKTIADLSMA